MMVSKVCNILMSIIIIILMITAGLFIVPQIIGYKSFAVVSGSMEPNIPVGSIVYAKEIEFNKLQEGDVITFYSGDNIVTHRIVEITDNDKSFKTKGDANNDNDGGKVLYSDIIGKVVFSLPFLGYISMNIKTPLGIAMICAVIFVILLLNYIPEIFNEEKE